MCVCDFVSMIVNVRVCVCVCLCVNLHVYVSKGEASGVCAGAG